jgi:hypothetical protein
MSISPREIHDMIVRERAENQRKAESGRELLMSVLHGHGVKKAIVAFDGCGDSGNMDVPRYHPDKNDIGKREVPNTMFESRAWDKDGVKTVKRNKTVDELVEDLCYTLLACSHPGWEINEGAFGEFTIDSDRNAVSLEFSQRIESVEYSEEEF